MSPVWMQDKSRTLIVTALTWIALLLTGSCVHEPLGDPFPDGGGSTVPGCQSNGDVCFEGSVLPIFLSSCARSGCHDPETREEGYVLDSYFSIVRKGISPGNADGSKLYRVLFENGEDQMPPDAPLSQAQKDSISAWINQGAKNTISCDCFCDTAKFAFASVIEPIIAKSCVGCHKPGALGGNIDLSNYAGVKLQAGNGRLLGSVTHAVGYVAMPQGGRLSDCEITQIASWIDSGAPDN